MAKASLDRTFNPVTITLTLNSKRELELVWALCAGDSNKFGEIVNSNKQRLSSNKIKPCKKGEFNFTFDFFDKVNDAWGFYGVDDKGSLFDPSNN